MLGSSTAAHAHLLETVWAACYTEPLYTLSKADTGLKTAITYSTPIHLTFEALRSAKSLPGVEVRSNVSRPSLALVCGFGRKDKAFSSALLLRMDRYGTSFAGTDSDQPFCPRLSRTRSLLVASTVDLIPTQRQ